MLYPRIALLLVAVACTPANAANGPCTYRSNDGWALALDAVTEGKFVLSKTGLPGVACNWQPTTTETGAVLRCADGTKDHVSRAGLDLGAGGIELLAFRGRVFFLTCEPVEAIDLGLGE